MRIALVVAVADNGVIGRAQGMPWHLPEDLRRFKALTLGKPILMGRRTFDSIGRALPGRRNLVLTHAAAAPAAGTEAVRDFDAALASAAPAEELCVIGGAEVYRLALPRAARIYLTQVHAAPVGDVYFPALDPAQWRESEREEFPADARHAHALSFLVLERTAPA